MPLSQDQIDQFERDGFIAVHDVLTPLELKALHVRMEDIGNEVVDFPQNHVRYRTSGRPGRGGGRPGALQQRS